MPVSYTGTKEDRLARLEVRGQRCDGQLRGCAQTAVVKVTRIAVSPQTGEIRDGAEAETVRACSKHRRQFSENTNYRTLHAEVIPPRGVSPQERRRGTERHMRMRALVGCTFVPAPGQPAKRIERVKYVVDDVRLTDEDGQTYMLRDVHQVNLHHGHDEAARTAADDDQDATESARRVSVPLAVRFSDAERADS